MQIIQSIQNRIYEVREERVMIDIDLAALYEVEVSVLNQAVKRNNKRFPTDFIFQLMSEEWDRLKSFSETGQKSMSSQFVMTYPKNLQNQLYHLHLLIMRRFILQQNDCS